MNVTVTFGRNDTANGAARNGKNTRNQLRAG